MVMTCSRFVLFWSQYLMNSPMAVTLSSLSLTPNDAGLPHTLRLSSLTTELVTGGAEGPQVTRVAGSTVTRRRRDTRAQVITAHLRLKRLWREESGLLGSNGCVSPSLESSDC